MAAVAATRHNPVLAAFDARLVAVMRKMLHALHRLLADPTLSLSVNTAASLRSE